MRADVIEFLKEYSALSPLPVCVVDGDEQILVVNNPLLELFAGDRSRLTGQPITVLLEDCVISAPVSSGSPSQTSEPTIQRGWLKRESGDRLPVTTKVEACYAEGEAFLAITVNDASDQEEASRRNRLVMLGTIAAHLAHELNNPIGAALLNAETALVLHERTGTDHDVQHCLDHLVSALQAAREISRQVLQFLRRDIAQDTACDCNDIVQRAVKLVQPLIARRSGQLELDLAEESSVANANGIELQMVLLNLVQNGLDACAESPLIRITTGEARGDAVLCVQDNGRGLTEEEVARAFDSTFSNSKRTDSTGLGLSLSRELIEAHGGKITLANRPEGGTTATIHLPLDAKPE